MEQEEAKITILGMEEQTPRGRISAPAFAKIPAIRTKEETGLFIRRAVFRSQLLLSSGAFMKTSIIASVSAFAASAAAHGGVLSYNLGGAWYNGFVPYNSPTNQPATIQREWDTYNPIQDPTSSSMACNANGAFGKNVATVKAGSKVTAYWNNPWPHNIGPVVVWMAACPGSCASTSPSGNAWFKIDQAGLESGTLATGHWAMADLIANNNSWTSTIPSTLAPGNYLLRHELLAIHTSNAPQWYPECAQLTITGSGTAKPASSYLAAIPGVYSMSDPEVNIDIYSNANQQVTTYNIPGPAVFKG
ncbi:MAG: hypothetical protein Q9227_001990 [Pyrenula ochraceoflavens]